VIVGSSHPGGPVNDFRPFIWEGGVLRELPTQQGASVSRALAIDDDGAAVGYESGNGTFDTRRGILWLPVSNAAPASAAALR
jgi:uncharacterized membrane protein